MLPDDIAIELAKLQDQVPPFPGDDAVRVIEQAQGRALKDIFKTFDRTALASASVAQVHLAELHDSREAAVKILRPGFASVIRNDLALLDAGASLMEWLWADGKRLKPHEVVAEFGRHLNDELDLMREAANASQLHRNFAAHCMVKTGRKLDHWGRQGAENIARSFSEYWTEERPLIVRHAEVEQFARDVDALRDDLARVEKRVERLGSHGSAAS